MAVLTKRRSKADVQTINGVGGAGDVAAADSSGHSATHNR